MSGSSRTFSPRAHAESPAPRGRGRLRTGIHTRLFLASGRGRARFASASNLSAPQHIRSRRDVIAKMQSVIENANLMTPRARRCSRGCISSVPSALPIGSHERGAADLAGCLSRRRDHRPATSAGDCNTSICSDSSRCANRRRIAAGLAKSWPANFFVRRSRDLSENAVASRRLARDQRGHVGLQRRQISSRIDRQHRRTNVRRLGIHHHRRRLNRRNAFDPARIRIAR